MILQEQLLGRLLIDSNTYFKTGSMITDHFFTDLLDKDIFNKYKDSLLNGEGIDVIKISGNCNDADNALLRVGYLISNVDYSLSIQSMLDNVFNKIKQQKIDIFKNDISQMDSCDPDKILTFINDFVTTFDDTGISIINSMAENVDEVLKIVEFNKTNSGLTGIDTGFRKLNRLTNGLQGGDLIIIAGETSQGKTSFALNIAQIAGRINPVYLVTCEMMASQITARMLSYSSKIDGNQILTGRLNDFDTDVLMRYSPDVAVNKLLINGHDNAIDKIIAGIRVYHATKHINMVVIDYLQLINTNDRANKEQQTAQITRRLKNLAKELNIPIILLSQLNRDKINPFPKLSRLRDSGQIEEAADLVIFVYRPEYYGEELFKDGSLSEGRAQIIIAKGRNTGIGTFYVKFHKEITKFEDEE